MQQEDKSSWRCFRGDNGWVYFGEMAWLHTASHEISHDYDSLEEEKKSEYRQVRHGRGVQLYGRTEEGVLVKYEGQWDRDRQAGRGRATLPDASIYEGEWANGLFNGSGNLTWATGDVYRGNWRAGKMEGGGKYVGGEGQTYEGIFWKNFQPRKQSVLGSFALRGRHQPLLGEGGDSQRSPGQAPGRLRKASPLLQMLFA